MTDATHENRAQDLATQHGISMHETVGEALAVLAA